MGERERGRERIREGEKERGWREVVREGEKIHTERERDMEKE